jgi:capsid protein
MNSETENRVEQPTPPNGRLNRLERRLLEAFDGLWDDFVDPGDALVDDDGTRWSLLGGGLARGASAAAFTTEVQLGEIRNQCRALAVGNEFAINGHENRISYIVGSGHSYRVTASPGRAAPDELVRAVQTVLDEFVRINRWHQRQQEIARRRDRDGEVFLRLFVAHDGTTRVRFVEPEQVSTPPEAAANPAASFGILTDPDDVETVLGYYVDGRLVDAPAIQHRKANVDGNVKRGLPLFYPVRANLRRAEKLLRNMSVVAEIQSAIAIIRKHAGGLKSTVEQFVQDQADLTVTHQATGRASHFRRYGPGTILDASAGTEYDFPAQGINAASFVAILQAELRAIASRLVMPEFMLTSDASNANYSSTMVAEGPAVKMFQRLQHETIEDDLEVMRCAVRAAVEAGRLPPEAMTDVEIQGVPPALSVRDRLKEAQADKILVQSGAMSPQTMALRHGLDPDKERQLVQKSPGGERVKASGAGAVFSADGNP